MSRSIGDKVAASVGVSHEPGKHVNPLVFSHFNPEIIECQITENDKFIVMGSDGVWEFLTNEVVTQLVAYFYEMGDINGCCEALLKESLFQWTQVMLYFPTHSRTMARLLTTSHLL